MPATHISAAPNRTQTPVRYTCMLQCHADNREADVAHALDLQAGSGIAGSAAPVWCLAMAAGASWRCTACNPQEQLQCLIAVSAKQHEGNELSTVTYAEMRTHATSPQQDAEHAGRQSMMGESLLLLFLVPVTAPAAHT